jgi:chromosome segregation ATPase
VFNRRETHDTLGERGILGDEAIAELLNTVEQLRNAVTDLKERVDSQFTTIAAHAEIARQQAELARNEARADLDRTRDTLLGLIEQVRAEQVTGTHVPGSRPGPSIAAGNERFESIEGRLVELATTVERCFKRQNELADTMTAFLDTMMAHQRGEPVAGLALH